MTDGTAPLHDRIVDAALELGAAQGWAGVRMVDVAARLGIPASEMPRHFRDLDSVANAWFLRAWQAMLADKPADFLDRPARERIEICLNAWFDRLAVHHRVTAEILRGKLHASHPHHWVPMVFDLSRTIHWLREAAELQARYGSRRSDMEEIGLTWLFLATLRIWCTDLTPGQRRTRRFLHRRLREADGAMARIWGRAAPPGSGTTPSTTPDPTPGPRSASA
jgi:AcrR family transcriptional regulator